MRAETLDEALALVAEGRPVSLDWDVTSEETRRLALAFNTRETERVAHKWAAMERLHQWRSEGTLTTTEFLIAIQDLALFEDGYHQASNEAVAAACSDQHGDGIRVTETQVRRAKKKLVALGFKRVTPRYAGDRRLPDGQHLEVT